MPQQFNNPANPEMHRKTTAVELLKQFERIDAFVAGVGTGGTITGVGEVLKEKMKGVRIFAVEPARVAGALRRRARLSQHPGHRRGLCSRRCSTGRSSMKSSRSATKRRPPTRRRLAAEEGLLVGISSGAACYAALKVARQLGQRPRGRDDLRG